MSTDMNIAVVNFNGGEFTAKIDARSDTEKYAGGCRQLANMIPLIFGGAEKRPGTEFISTDGAFNAILARIVANDNDVMCWENQVVVTDYSSLISQISCWENDVMCYENEVVTDTSLMTFLSRVLCYENNMLFHENEVVYI